MNGFRGDAGKRALWLGWSLVCCGVAIGAMALARFVPDMGNALREPEILGMDERLSNVTPPRPWLREQTGGRWGRYGWHLLPGEVGQVRIQLPGSDEGMLQLRLWAYSPGRLSVRISDGIETHDIPPSHLDGRILTYRMKMASELTLSASNDLSEEQLVLDRVTASWSRTDDRLPPVWPLGSALAICLVGVLLVAGRGAPRQCWPLWAGSCLIVAAIAIGFSQRWDLLNLARGLPPDPDTAGYVEFARRFAWGTSDHGFYSGNFMEREPVHVAALHTWFQVWGETVPAAKFYTAILSVLLIPICGLWVWALTGQWLLGSAVSWVMALSPAWIDESVRGLRTESLTLMLLVVLAAWLWSRGWMGAVLLGVAIGFMALIQSPALAVWLPFIWLGWLVNLWRTQKGRLPLTPGHWSAHHLVLASCLAVLIYAPHLYGLSKVHGDPSWPSSRYARWNANVEFPERIGTPGFPSAEELARNVYAGPAITYGDYLFGLHSVPQLIRGQIKGWVESTGYMSGSLTPGLKEIIFLYHASGLRAVLRHVRPGTVVIFVVSLGLTVLGFVEFATHARYWWVPVLSLWGTWYAAYLYSVRLVEPFRHTGHVYPLLLLCLVWGGYRCARTARQMLSLKAAGQSATCSESAANL